MVLGDPKVAMGSRLNFASKQVKYLRGKSTTSEYNSDTMSVSKHNIKALESWPWFVINI